MLVDSHCHLTAEAYRDDLPAVLERAWQAGVGHIVVIGESPAAADAALALATSNSRLSATAGIHPHDASDWSAARASWLEGVLRHEAVVAAGEMGLDYHYDHSPRPAQQEAFDRQLDLAARARKPAVVHAREADDDVLAILANHPGATAILHSYSSGLALLRWALDRGHYVSFSGMVTFRNWTLDDLIRAVPGERLLVETDGPYLAPVPHRGRRNEPALVQHVARRLAEVRGVPPERVIEETGTNAARVFGRRVSS
jgi:TatD DNase family protein